MAAGEAASSSVDNRLDLEGRNKNSAESILFLLVNFTVRIPS